MLGERIRQRRTILRITRSELADLIGVGVNTIFRWETGDRTPSDKNKLKLAQALETTVAYLFGETDYSSPPNAQIKNCVVETLHNSGTNVMNSGTVNHNGSSTTHVENQIGVPQNIVVTIGDARIEFPPGTPAYAIRAAIEGVKKGKGE
jgi:DNA-binding XRE family transcriptional regulator